RTVPSAATISAPTENAVDDGGQERDRSTAVRSRRRSRSVGVVTAPPAGRSGGPPFRPRSGQKPAAWAGRGGAGIRRGGRTGVRGRRRRRRGRWPAAVRRRGCG